MSVSILAGVLDDDISELRRGQFRRTRRRIMIISTLAVLVVAVFMISLMVGHTFYGLDKVIAVVLGDNVAGASFTVGELRLPRATLALLTGSAFGVAGVTFQTMLRNPLASPDIIGISSGASAAAVIAIVVLGLNETMTSVSSLIGALGTALAIYGLSNRGGFAGSRLILIGIGVGAMLNSVVGYVLSRASAWDMQTATQWLTGNLNGASWGRALPLAVAWLVLVPMMVLLGKRLGLLRMGDDLAAALGVPTRPTRLLLILGAVALLAFATAASGPVAFVAFMAGPIAVRLLGPGTQLLIPAGLVGALLVMVADLLGQWAFDTSYPVGVITGVLGAPYLIYLLIRSNRAGASL